MADKKITQMLQRLGAAEQEFLASRFLAPVVRGRGVQVRILGVRWDLRVSPVDFEGWGLLRPVSLTAAELIRPAQLAERRRYLGLFAAVSVVLCVQDQAHWQALTANASDRRIDVDGLLPVHLASDVDLFDTVRTRFDGVSFWFDQPDARAEPAAAAYLRRCLDDMRDPRTLDRPALTARQREAYALAYARRLQEQAADEAQRAQILLRGALEHGGAQLRDFSARADIYRVTYEVDGRRHTSVVRKDNLAVQSAGVCLAGQDHRFDLQSLVGVLRQGARGGTLRPPHP